MSIPSKTSLQKRKRDDDTSEHELDARPFTIKPSGNDSFAKTKSFTPVCVLNRAQLPLAWIDTASAGSQLFSARVRVLEAYAENGEDGELLVVEERDGEGTGRLCAIERAGRGVYALCRLGSWVEKDVLLAFTGKKKEVSAKRRAIESDSGAPWWSAASVEEPAEPAKAREETGRTPKLSMGENISKSPAAAAPKSAGDAPDAVIPGERVDTIGGLDRVPPLEEAITQDPLEELAKQYLDALYLSRTSLAYFAKGPLSRARAAFADVADSDLRPPQLLAFLRDILLPSSITDQKDKRYKVKIPSIIKELPVFSPEKGEGRSKSRKKKRMWKPRRDKSGFLPTERECLEAWWRNDMIPSNHLSSPEPPDVTIRKRLQVLRTRETYLQIIIILEVLALESHHKIDYQAVAKPSLLTMESQEVESQDMESQAAPEMKISKPKKAQDLHKVLETLLERLNIAHCADSLAPTPVPDVDGDTAKEESSDELKSFCTDVIIPFYVSRLPKEAALVNRQLGGPSPPSPAKRQTATSSRTTKPGQTAIRKPPERRPREPLTRVRTETLNASSNTAPGLHRSASDPLLRSMKREPSESTAPLSAIPQRRPRPDRLQELSQSHRTVNLEAKAKAAEAKRRKNAETESQIRDALAAVRKPNRELANRETAERADERFRQVTAKPQRPARPNMPMVAATPKRAGGASFVPASVVPATRDTVAPVARYLPASQSHVSDTPALARSHSLMESSSRIGESPVNKPSFLASLPESPTARRKTTALVASTPMRPTRVKDVDVGAVGETPRRGDGIAKLNWFPRDKEREEVRNGERLVPATPVKNGR